MNKEQSLLKHLLDKINKLFHPRIDKRKLKKSICHSFDLYNHRGYWGFKIINNWHEWMNKGYETDFGLYRNPEHALMAFLAYVKMNKIKVNKLMH